MSFPQRQASTPRQIGSITRNSLILNGLLNNLPGRDQIQVPTTPVFVHPILTPEDFKKTMANYNLHIEKYNMKLFIDHAEIRKYNAQVKKNRLEAVITVEQRVREQIWKEDRKGLHPEEYNDQVEAYNAQHGFMINKKVLRQRVKPTSEKVFLALLHQYNMQLFRRKNQRISLEVHVTGELPRLEIYPNKVVEARRDGYVNLPVSVETLREHRERLEEAGVLQGYSYHGPNRPVKIGINPSILSITDNGSPKNTNTENQSLTQSQTKKVPHNNVSSRNQVNKFKYREEGDLQKSKSSSSCTKTTTKESTKTPKRQGGKFSGAPNDQPQVLQKKFTGGRDFLAEKSELSAVLMDQVQEKTELVRELAAGTHWKYRPIDPAIAQFEAYSGAMHPEDFRELAIQDVFKYASQIFRDLPTHPGSWMNAYKYWMEKQFKTFTGNNLKKDNTFEKWMKCIVVLREVRKYKKAHQAWQPAFPSLYFDPARTFKENNSFEYAFKCFRLKDEKLKSFQSRKINAGKSARHKTDVAKAREKIRHMINGKISLDQVFEFVGQNCSKEVNENLSKLIKKEFSLHKQKS